MSRIQEIISYESRLDHLFDIYSQVSDDTLVQSNWSRYLCVLTAGYLEISVRAILIKYSKDKSSQYVSNYIENKLNAFQNASMGNILNLITMFNLTWADTFKEKTKGELADAINSIVNNRHNIAHGKNVGITFVYIRAWYKQAIKAIEILEELILS